MNTTTTTAMQEAPDWDGVLNRILAALLPAGTQVFLAGAHTQGRASWPVSYEADFPGKALVGPSHFKVVTSVGCIAPAAQCTPASPAEVLAAVRAGGITAAKPTAGPTYRRAMWDLHLGGTYLGTFKTKREAMSMAPIALAVFEWQIAATSALAAIPADRLELAAQMAPGFATAFELAAAVVALCAEPAATRAATAEPVAVPPAAQAREPARDAA